MKVIVEIESGSDAGRRIVLREGHQVRFGRTSRADAHFPSDDTMSGLHFQILADDKACYLQDLGSRNGSFVNEEAISSVVLRTGDVVRAGRTQFRIQVQGDRPDEALPLEQVQVAERPSPSMSATVVAAIDRAPFEMEACRSGLTMCRGRLEEAPPSTLIEMLGSLFHCYLLVNFPMLELSASDDIESPDFVYDWVDPQTAPLVSPVLVATAEVPKWPEYLLAGWDADAVVCLFSDQEKDTVLEGVRAASQVETDVDGQLTQNALGVAWPGVISPLLYGSESDVVERLMNGVNAVLVSDPTDKGLWQMFGRKDLPKTLGLLGMVESPDSFRPTAD